MNRQKIMLFLIVISFSNVLYSFATPWMPCENINTLTTSYVDSSSLTVSMKANIFCVEINYTHLETDGCKSDGVHCPILTESTVTYPLAVTIPGLCHGVTTKIIWSV
ncbi:hypothetical protein MXB_3150 [Myxobolus squamalis]|nr:hypothetical protein MXB_3150 [Myxobolus squamalis]